MERAREGSTPAETSTPGGSLPPRPLPRSSAGGRRTGRRRWVAAGIAVLAVAVVVAVVILPDLTPAAGTSCTPAPPPNLPNGDRFIVVNCGTRETLAAHSFTSYQANRLSDDEFFIGQYSAPQPVESYLLNTSELDALNAAPPPSAPPPAYFWSGGNGTLCTLSAEVLPSPATYFLVLENRNAENVSLVWSETLELYYTPTIPA